MSDPPNYTILHNIVEELIHQTNDSYIVTGLTVDGKRFRIATDNPVHALGINLYRGTVWLVRNEKRSVLYRVWN